MANGKSILKPTIDCMVCISKSGLYAPGFARIAQRSLCCLSILSVHRYDAGDVATVLVVTATRSRHKTMATAIAKDVAPYRPGSSCGFSTAWYNKFV